MISIRNMAVAITLAMLFLAPGAHVAHAMGAQDVMAGGHDHTQNLLCLEHCLRAVATHQSEGFIISFAPLVLAAPESAFVSVVPPVRSFVPSDTGPPRDQKLHLTTQKRE